MNKERFVLALTSVFLIGYAEFTPHAALIYIAGWVLLIFVLLAR